MNRGTYVTGGNGPSRQGKLYGQKKPLKPKEIWEIRMHLEMGNEYRDLALFNLGIDSKLRGCDLLALKVHDVMQGGQVLSRTNVLQRKTQRPVRFELTEATRNTVGDWIKIAELTPGRYLFPGKKNPAGHLSSRQYSRIVDHWVESIGLDPDLYGTHTMRRTKPTLIYQKTKNIRAVQLLLGHTKIENTVRYLGIEVDDALEISEQIDV